MELHLFAGTILAKAELVEAELSRRRGTFRVRADLKENPLNRGANIEHFYSLSKYFDQIFETKKFWFPGAIYILVPLMIDKPEIQLLKGFCSLAFGTSKESAVLVFGEPEEVQNLSDELLNNNSTVYHYWNHGYSLFFDVNKNHAFCSVEIDNKDTLLFDMKLFSLKEKEIIALMKQNGYAMTDTEVHQWGEKRVSFDNAGLDCYFENNRLVSVNFGIPETEPPFYYFPN